MGISPGCITTIFLLLTLGQLLCASTAVADHDINFECCDGEIKPESLKGSSASEWTVKEAILSRDVFTDFSGRRFKFEGNEEESYNLITEADHQVNAILSTSKHRARQVGATLRGVGIHGPDTRVKIFVDDDSQLEVAVNERQLPGDSTRLDGVIVSRGCVISECASLPVSLTVSVRDRSMALYAWIIPANGKDDLSLSFKVLLKEQPMSQVHGILGQSLESQVGDAVQVSMPSNLQFYGEGQISDYSTTDLFSSDSTFSIFTRKVERRRQKRKRQMLEGNALASLAFAARSESNATKQKRSPKLHL